MRKFKKFITVILIAVLFFCAESKTLASESDSLNYYSISSNLSDEAIASLNLDRSKLNEISRDEFEEKLEYKLETIDENNYDYVDLNHNIFVSFKDSLTLKYNGLVKSFDKDLTLNFVNVLNECLVLSVSGEANTTYILDQNLEIVKEVTTETAVLNSLYFNNNLYLVENATTLIKLSDTFEEETIAVNIDLTQAVVFENIIYTIANSNLVKASDFENITPLFEVSNSAKLVSQKELVILDDTKTYLVNGENTRTIEGTYKEVSYLDNLALSDLNSIYLYNESNELVKTLPLKNINIKFENGVVLFYESSLNKVSDISNINIKDSNREITNETKVIYDDLTSVDLKGNNEVDFITLDKSILYRVNKGENVYLYEVNLHVNGITYTRNETLPLVNNDIYLLGDIIDFKGSALLNGEEVTTGFSLTKKGLNTLVVTLDNGIVKTYNLNVFDIEGLASGTQYETLDAPKITFESLSNLNVKLNGKEFASGETIDTFGDYTLEVYGLDDNLVTSYTFTINPTIYIDTTKVNVSDNIPVTYSKNLDGETVINKFNSVNKTQHTTLSWTGNAANAILNNHKIYSGFETYNPGNNSLTLFGESNYQVTINFYITPLCNLVDKKEYIGSVLPVVSGGKFKLNEEAYELGQEVKEAGDYKFDIYNESKELVKTIEFYVLPEELNVTETNQAFDHGVIPAVCGNYMTISNGTKTIEYISGQTIAKAGKYELNIYYKGYPNSKNLRSETFDSEKGTYKVTYNFEIKKGVNIKDGDEFFDSKIILFAGYETASLTYVYNDNVINVEDFKSGYRLDVIGKYQLHLDDEIIDFIISPKLNVENAKAYIGNQSIFDYYTFNITDLSFELTSETGKDVSNLKTINGVEELKGLKLGSGTYQLKINARGGYEKIINYIIIDSEVINIAAVYFNGHSFEFNMYGVSVNLTFPLTDNNTNRITKIYKDNQEIKTVGKHYFTFTFNLNGLETTTESTNTVIYFYIKPVVTLNGTKTDSQSLVCLDNATITFKDGNGISYNDFDMDKNSKEFSQGVLYDEVGNHYITVHLDDIDYVITLVINTNVLVNESDATSTLLDYSNTYTYLNNVTFKTSNETALSTLDLDKETNYYLKNIDLVGNHSLFVRGSNKYIKELKFVVKEEVFFNSVKANSTLDTPALSLDDYTYEIDVVKSVSIIMYGKADVSTNFNADSLETSVLVDEIGNYKLVVSGTNKYEATYMFRLKDNLKMNGVSPEKTYNQKVVITCEKMNKLSLSENKLDSSETEIKSNSSFDIVGSYVVIVYGNNDYTNVYRFDIENEIDYTAGNISQILTSGLKISDTISLTKKYMSNYKSIKLDDVNIETLPTLDTLGLYNLVLEDYFGNLTKYVITISSDVLFNDDTIKNEYTTSVKANTTKVNVLSSILNGKEYVLNTKFNTLGKNTLVLIGNNLKETYTIFIKETNSGNPIYKTENEALANSVDSLSFDFGNELIYTLELNEDDANAKNITTYGMHKVVIKGIDYQNVYYFMIKLIDNLDNTAYSLSYEVKSNALSTVINSSDNTLNNVGKYIVTFNGVGNKKISKNVVIQEEVLNATSSDMAITPVIKGKVVNALLSYETESKTVTSTYNGETIDQIGTYTLIINGENGYKNAYSFTLKSPIQDNMNNLDSKVEKKTNVSLNQYGNLSYVKYELDDKEIEIDNYELNEIGKHILKAYNKNGMIDSYEIIILEETTGSTLYLSKEKAKANPYTVDEVVAKFQDNLVYQVLVDGKTYNQKDLINTYGYHEIVVKGHDYESKPYYAYVELVDDLDNEYLLHASFTSNASSVLVDGINSDSLIDTIGNHMVTFKGFGEEITKNVLVRETISNFENGKIYTSSISPVVNGNGIEIELNGKSFNSGDKVNKIGSYTLKVSGKNYSNIYTFDLLGGIKNVNSTSDKAVTIGYDSDLVFDSLLLNGKNIELPYKVNTIGNNKLVSKDVNGNITNYTIDILETINGAYDSKAKAIEYSVDKASVTCGDDLVYTLLLDGKSYTKNDSITVWGTHEITVVGANYKTTYYLHINLLKNVEDNDVYILNKEIETNAKETYVDLQESKIINKVGNHIVSLISFDGEEVDLNVVVKENVLVTDSNEEFIPLIYGNITGAKLNGEDYTVGTIVSLVGQYTLQIYGENDYVSSEYKFSLTSDINVLNNASDIVTISLTSNTLKFLDVSVNGTSVELPYQVNTVGNNKVVFTDVNLNEHVEEVVITETLNKDSMPLFTTKASAFENKLSISSNIPTFNQDLLFDIYLDDVLYNKQAVEAFGYHKVSVKGVNYQNDYYCFIEENVEYKFDNLNLLIFTKANGRLFVNENEVSLNEIVNTIGNNKCLLKSFDNESIYEFVITVDGSINNFKESFDSSVRLSLNGVAKDVLVNGESKELGLFDTVGDYEITVIGVNDYKKIYNFTINYLIEGISEEYQTKAVIKASGVEMFIDGIKYNSGDEYSVVGTHTLFVHGLENVKDDKYYTFTIFENVSGISNNETYDSQRTIVVPDAKSLVINKGQADEFVISSGDTINKVGNFTLNVIGTNDYVSAPYNFVIEANVGDVASQKYNTQVSPKFINNSLEAKTYLNGEEYNYETIYKIGRYHFEIQGLGNYVKSYDFVIESSLLFNSDELMDSYNNIVTFKNSNDVILGDVLVNGNKTTTNFIDTIGNNIITLIGEGDYRENIKVTILETPSDTIYDSKSKAYLNSLDFNKVTFGDTLKYSLTLDDNPYFKNDLVNSFGLHKVVISGVDYNNTYYFDINLVTDLKNGASYENKCEFESNARVIIDNNMSDLDTIGNHMVKFIGNSNEEVIYNIVVKEVVNNVSDSNSSITPLTSSKISRATLNGEDYDFSELNTKGKYELDIYGVNGYKSSYKFELRSDLLLDDQQIESISNKTASCVLSESSNLGYKEIYLNDSLVNLPLMINTIGNNIVKTIDYNNVVNTYLININETSQGTKLYDSLTDAKINSYKVNDKVVAIFNKDLNYKLYLDGNEYSNTIIDYYGYHKITVSGVNYSHDYFVYIELDTNIFDNAKYNEQVRINANANIYVDGEEVNNNYLLNAVGNHSIKFEGLNASEVFDITVSEIVMGIENNAVYKNEILFINVPHAKLRLNGSDYISNTKISNVGNYTLEVFGTNSYYNKYVFRNDYLATFKDNDSFHELHITIPNATVYLDGALYDDSLVKTIGNHTVTIIGEAGYNEEIHFVITPDFVYENTLEKNHFNASFDILNSYESVEIDNVTYTNGNNYDIVGNHVIKITGLNGYVYTKNFTVDAYVPVENEGNYYNKIIIDNINADLTLDGVKINEDTVVKNGTHRLIIKGSNGYESDITFKYSNPNITYAIIYSSVVALTGLIVVLFIIVKRGKKND